jgi:phosphatidylglycerophosphate synthase
MDGKPIVARGDGVSGVGDRRPIAARNSQPAIWLAERLVRAKVSPNAISVAGMLCAMLAGLAFALVAVLPGPAWPLWLVGAVLVPARLLANMLDGMVAIGRGIASPVGELFNEVPDRVSDVAVLLGLSLGAGAGWGLGLGAGLAAIATAYVRALGRAAGTKSDFSGPMAKQQRMAAATALAVWCAVAPAGWGAGSALPAVVLAAVTALTAFTAARRLWRIAGALRGGAAP